MGLNVTDPIISGSIRAVYDASSVSNTDWNDLTSSDFVDSTTGTNCDSDLTFSFLAIINKGSDIAYLKYRARDTASDPTTNEIKIESSFSDDIGTLRNKVTTISYQKNSASDVFYFIAGFSK